jgi:hypothetical protein
VASNINYLSINENFPVAGQDNDTQVFRDNFDTIKTSLRNAKEEITDLQGDTAKVNVDNDFELNKIQRALLQNNRTQKFDGGAVTATPTTIDYENANYQIYRVGANLSMDFLNFPGDPVFTSEVTPIGMGKVTLELYGDGTKRLVTFSTSGGTVIKKNGFPALTEVGSHDFEVSSTTDPVFIEVWRHSEDNIFIRYIGQFS